MTLSISVHSEDVQDSHGVVRMGGGVSGLQVLLNHLHTQKRNADMNNGQTRNFQLVAQFESLLCDPNNYGCGALWTIICLSV